MLWKFDMGKHTRTCEGRLGRESEGESYDLILLLLLLFQRLCSVVTLDRI